MRGNPPWSVPLLIAGIAGLLIVLRRADRPWLDPLWSAEFYLYVALVGTGCLFLPFTLNGIRTPFWLFGSSIVGILCLATWVICR